jgi:tetratricopeptide (TPR) repeat protein
MRSLNLSLLLLIACGTPVLAQDDPFTPPQLQMPPDMPPGFEMPEGFAMPEGMAPEDGDTAAAEAPKPPTAEEILADLAAAASEDEARDLESRLHTLWSRSNSATADILLSRSNEALEEDNTEIAAELAEKVTELAPEFAEGWHQRAVIAMHLEDFEDAVTSLRHTLSLQPKHFIALAELGSILEEFGDEENALAAYREALALNPFIDGLAERIRELTRSVEGQGI